ncbi:MAG: hypothetical protein WBA51_06065 [Erythrobacter sp.]
MSHEAYAALGGSPSSFRIAGVTFNPDRTNVMSYFRCATGSLTPMQIGTIRKTLNHPFRSHLIAASKGQRQARSVGR